MTRKLSIWLPAAALLLPLAGLGIWNVSEPSDDHNSLGALVEGSGYRELMPPSQLFGPGTIGTVERLPDGSLQLHLACTMDNQELASLWQQSSTVNRQFASKLEDSYKASAEALRKAIANTAGTRVKRVSASLQDMHVITMTHENLLKIRSKYLAGSCEEAIIWNLQAGANVCQTEEVLQADIAYKVDFEDGLSATEKAELTKEISASVDISHDNTGTDEVRGDDLYFGVKLNVTCFRLDDSGRRVAGTHSS
ncbi:MAG: hypothetical protein JNJ53_12140 [Rhizobiales bacterium]|nr:hypothetical protein [Hyphomicrobiales bacterium]